MATQIISTTFPLSSDARFRAWGLGLSDAFAAMGLVKTADAGQIDWGTVIKPVATQTVAGFEIWRFADSLQATAPVYLKIEYGTGSNASAPSLWVTVGVGTNGAGTLVGPATTTTRAYHSVAMGEGSIGLTYISGATNRLVFFAHLGTAATTNTSMVLGIERTKDDTGADTAEGVLVFLTTSSGSSWRQQVLFPTGAGTQETTLGIIMPTVGTGANGVQIAVYPQFYTKGVFLNPALNLLGYINANLSALTPTAITIYGATHTYLPIGTSIHQSLARVGPTGVNGAAPLMRWE